MEMLRTLFEFWGWCGRRIIRVGDDDDGEAAVPVMLLPQAKSDRPCSTSSHTQLNPSSHTQPKGLYAS